MKSSIKKVVTQNIFIYLTYLLAIFPVLPFIARSITMILWSVTGVVLWLLNYSTQKEIIKSKAKYFKYFVISVLPFLYLVLSLFYSENFSEGLKKLIKMLSFLIFPLIFYLNRDVFSKKMIKNIIWIFCFSVVAFIIFQIIASVFNIDYLLADLTEEEIRRNNLSKLSTIEPNTINSIKIRRFRSSILELVDTHFTYQGLWISFVFFVFVKEGYLRLNKNRVQSIILFFTAAVLIIWLMLLSTRMPLLAIIIASFITLFMFIKVKVKTLIFLIITSVLLSLTSYFVFIPIKVRVDEIFTTKFSLPTTGNDIQTYNSVNVRNGIYYCSVDVIKNNILFGVGIGDQQDQLNMCYKNKIGAKIYKWRDYNSHNQYLFFLLCTGIGGLLFFLMSIYIQIKKAITLNQATHFYFLVIIILISITENILVRSDGIMFYAFFGNLFLFNSKKQIL